MPDIAPSLLDAAQNAMVVPSTTYYLGLHTADPGGTGASEGADGRQTITFGSSSGGVQASTSGQTWSAPGAGHTYTFFGVWTASSGGTWVRGGPLNQQVVTATGSSVVIASGGIQFLAA